MSAFWQSFGATTKALSFGWGAFAGLGTFLIYLFGYLTLRSHLTAFGIETELNLLDERYLFAGSRFLIYLLASIPIVLLVVLPPVGVVWGILALKRRLFPTASGESGGIAVAPWYSPLQSWWLRPLTPALTGIVVAVVLIQLVMRKCFVFSNLLVGRDDLPGPQWLETLLLTESEWLKSLYFAGLVGAIAVCGGLLLAAANRKCDTTWSRFHTALLTLLVGIQVLLLPVNYGILISGNTVPRVLISDSEQKGLQGCATTWRIWEGKEWIVLYCRSVGGEQPKWRMLVIGLDKESSTEILGFDPILRLRFGH